MKLSIRLFSSIFLLAGTLALAITFGMAGNLPWYGQYEVDIYQAYPFGLWGLLIFAMLSGFCALFIELFADEQSYRWVFGFALVATVNAFALAIPTLRNYAFTTQWDSIAHFSRVTNILEVGRPDVYNIYPMAHQLAGIFALFTGSATEDIILLLPVIFYLIYLANIIFLAFVMLDCPAERGLMAALALPLVYGTYSTIFRPMQLAVYMLPFFLAWLFKARGIKGQIVDSFPFLLLLVCLPFLHPWMVVAAWFLMILLRMASFFSHLEERYRLSRLVNSMLLVGVLWLAWFENFVTFTRVIRDLTISLIQGTSPNPSIDQYLSIAQRAQLPLKKIITLLIFRYGAMLLYFIPAGLIIIWLLIMLIRRRHLASAFQFALAGFIVVFGLLAVLSQFRNLFTADPLRFLNIATVLMPLFITITLYRAIQKTHRGFKFMLAAGLLVTLVCAAVLGVFTSYESPLTGRPNTQFTYGQGAGMRFLVDKASRDNKGIYAPVSNAFSLFSVLNASDARKLMITNPLWRIQIPPSHFGYGTYTSDTRYENPGYLIITAYERAYYTQIWSQEGRYTRQDFDLLEQDPMWNKIYTSGNMSIWRWSKLEEAAPGGGNE